jgi:para-nitrobenzyl esterase
MRFPSAFLAIALVFTGCGAPPPPAPTSDPVTKRTISSGEVVGFVGAQKSQVWRGIPYAAAPAGALRWRAPRDPAKWQGVREALAFGARCPQYTSSLEATRELGTVYGSEDCLTLNVWSPPHSETERLPVMFWIHGGGNVQGGQRLLRRARARGEPARRGRLVKYRLGPLGWLRHAALREGATYEEASGNFGTLDMIHALRWVRDEHRRVRRQSGERDDLRRERRRVETWSRCSSRRPRAGSFHGAIVESGGTRSSGLDEAEQQTADPRCAAGPGSHQLPRTPRRVREKLAGMSNAEIAAYLRAQTPETILKAYPETNSEGDHTGFYELPQQFRDGVVLPTVDAPAAFAAGDYNRVPVILGTNHDESKIFMFASSKYVRRFLGIPRLRDAESYYREASYRSRFWKAYGVDEPAAAMRRVQGPSVYAYRFDWDEEPSVFGADLGKMLGAAHVMEVPFVFGHWNLGPNSKLLFDDDNAAARLALSDQMQSYWGQFAWTGSPGRGRDGKLPAWSAWDPSQPTAGKYIVFDTAAGGGVRMAHETESTAAVVAELTRDPAFDAAARCALLAEWTRDVPTVIARVEGLGCSGPAVAARE